ncbi:MAG: molybdenum cofactor guanylyltransferase [Gammaproteobacteria bacterium]|nr:molybdenum cofactor guanylyltransferase [Gammaproteobacteria bacterium]
MTPLANITGVILAGGRGTRMGGVDKGLVLLDGKPLVEHVLHRLEPQVSSIIISANRNFEVYAGYGFTVVSDEPGSKDAGPLAGILSAMTHARTNYIVTVPCDAPRLPTDLAARLLAQLKRDHSRACMAHDGVRPQPIFTLLHVSLKDALHRAVHAGEYIVAKWLQNSGCSSADFSGRADCFINLNTAENIAEFNAHK